MTLPVWGLLLLILAVAAACSKAARTWLLAVAVVFGLLVASTSAGQSAITTINHLVHPSPTSTGRTR